MAKANPYAFPTIQLPNFAALQGYKPPPNYGGQQPNIVPILAIHPAIPQLAQHQPNPAPGPAPYGGAPYGRNTPSPGVPPHMSSPPIPPFHVEPYGPFGKPPTYGGPHITLPPPYESLPPGGMITPPGSPPSFPNPHLYNIPPWQLGPPGMRGPNLPPFIVPPPDTLHQHIRATTPWTVAGGGLGAGAAGLGGRTGGVPISVGEFSAVGGVYGFGAGAF